MEHPPDGPVRRRVRAAGSVAGPGSVSSLEAAWSDREYLARLVHDIRIAASPPGCSALLLTAFYVVLYFTEYFTPASPNAIGLGSKWTLYGVLYTIAIVIGGIYVIRKYRHNRYQVVRTCVGDLRPGRLRLLDPALY